MFWVYAAYIGKRLFSLLRTAILARILIPEDLGLFSFAVLIITYIEIVRGFGIREALIYNSEDLEDAADRRAEVPASECSRPNGRRLPGSPVRQRNRCPKPARGSRRLKHVHTPIDGSSQDRAARTPEVWLHPTY